MPDRLPDRRFSGAESTAGIEARRQKTIDALTQAYASDLLSVEEYEARVTVAAGAAKTPELDALISDLPVPTRSSDAEPRRPERGAGPGRPSPVPRPYAAPRAAEYGGSGISSVACIMGDRNMTGNWLDSDRVHCFTLMGSTRLDLRDADLPESGPVRIEAFVLMGETVVIVPRELPVRLTAMPFMGEARARRDVDQNIRGARRWLEISGLVVMGAVVVKAAD